MASDTQSGPKSGSSNNSTSSGTPSPPASPPPSPPASPPPPPTPPSSPPPSPPASPPPAPPQSPPPSPPQHSSSPPPPTKQASPASPPPPEKSDSPTPPKNSQSSPEGSTPPSTPSPQSSGTPSPPSQLVATPPPPNAATAGSVFSPPHPISESTPETPATHASSTNNHSPPSHSPPHAKGSTNSSSANHLSSPQSSGSLSATDAGLIGGLVVAGIFVIAFIIICVACSRRKRKRQYYLNPTPRPNDQFYNGAVQPHDHVVKLSPGGANNGWGAPPPPPSGNISSEFNSSGQHHGQHLPPASPKMGGLGGFNQSQFTYEELAAATGGFSQSNLIGQGGFGFVHKGVLSDKREVAVKSLKSGSGQGEREFQAEVDIISRVHHRHLVSLFGYCITEKQRMLVYEFVPNKTLEFHLHGTGNPPMDWSTRLRIALGSAKGLAYLHEDCHPRIIHRDIKAANILLDANFEAMVADFGLAKLTSDNYTHVSTRVMGTFGYLAPEYAQSGKLTEKSDVFSFGVMLLELITGRRPVDTSNRMMEDSLVDWARPLLAKALEDGNYEELADPRLEGNYIPHEMARMVACASASIRHSARRRPKMSQIVRSLQGDSALEELNEGVKPGNSSAYSTTGTNMGYDTGAYNADMMKFRKMIMPSQEFTSGECGATSEYGLNPSSSSSDGYSGPQKHK